MTTNNTEKMVVSHETLLDIVNAKIIALDLQAKTLSATLADDKAAGNPTEDKKNLIKHYREEIKTLNSFASLIVIKDYTSTDFFRLGNDANKLGQFFGFTLEAAKKTLNFDESIKEYSELVTLVNGLKPLLDTIKSIIDAINASEIYEKVYTDMIPRFVDNKSQVDFSPLKKHIDEWVKANNAIFSATVNVCINSNDVKAMFLSIADSKQNATNNFVRLKKFNVFLDSFQGMVQTKINNVTLKVGEKKK